MTRIGLLFATLLLAVSGLAADQPKSATFSTSDGVKLHYIESGKGPAIVFIPGWTMPATIWQPQIDSLSRNYHVVALDPRSQGDSDKPTDGHYLERRAQDVKELINHLKLENVVLVGWSLAVPELVTYAKSFDNAHTAGYVLVDGMLWDKPDPKATAEFAGWMTEFQKARVKSTTEFVRNMYKKPHPPEYFKSVEQASFKTPSNTAAVLIYNMAAVTDFSPAIRKITVPVMFTYTPDTKSSADLVKSLIPSTRLELFEDDGHALFVDNAERFNRVLDEFTKSVQPR
ncbi:MAG TPA: alpha/beta hydrolase [Clostridia bacterium]|nr:alpha/beta hydrolase [Clostridia bacterium]